MPFEYSPSHDPLTRITELQTSTIIEMLSGLHVLSHRWRRSDWKDKATAALGDDFMESLKKFAEQYQLGTAFIELTVDYPDHHDVPGFIERVRSMSARDLAFYLLGRVYPRELLPDEVSRGNIEKVIKEYPSEICNNCLYGSPDWADDIEKIQTEATRLWSEYWDTFFREDVANCTEYWESANRELEEYLIRFGGSALYNKFYSGKELPPQVPEDVPYTVLRYIPVYHPFSSDVKYFGYGNITILYDCKRNTAYEQSKEEAEKDALRIARALGDNKRLQILKLISEQEFGLNGKAIALKMNLSASVVSRHLSQLRKADLITEKSEDNRNITYKLNWKRIDGLSRRLMFFLGNE